MEKLKILQNPFARIKGAHFAVIALLLINILFFTSQDIAIYIQIALIIAVILHHADDKILMQELLNKQSSLEEESDIFDRNILITEADLNGVITYANQNYCDVSGFTQEELIGSTHAIVRSPDTTQEEHKELWDIISNDGTYVGIKKNVKKDGTSFWIDLHISPVYKKSKKVAYKAIMFDVTDKMLAQENLINLIEDKDLELQKQMDRFEFAINSSRDGFWDYNLLSGEFFLSDGWKKRLGFAQDEQVTYLDYLALIPDEHRFEHHIAMHDTIENHSGSLNFIHYRVKYPVISKNSEKLMIEDVGDVFFDENHNPLRITGFHRDITDQERQAKIIESQNRLAAMGDVISNISHQWRQPIGAINNILNDVELDIELEDSKQLDSEVFLNVSKKVKEYTSYLSQTIDDFRKLSSDDKVKNNFFVKQTIENASNITKNEFDKHHIGLQVLISGEQPCELRGYERELQQVIINLLNNAKDILVEREVDHPKVIVTIITTESKISIIVHDNGGGIPENIITKIFDPYFTTKHESMGTGIGLYMSKKIIDEHFNGELIVENENNGAKFTITLPR